MNTEQFSEDTSAGDTTVSNEELSSFLAARFNENLKAFTQYLPEIAAFFENYLPQKKLSFCCGRNGVPNLFLKDENRFFYRTDDPISFCRNMIVSLIENAPFNVSNYQVQEDPFGQIYDKYLNEAITRVNKTSPEKLKVKDLDIVPLSLVVGVGLGYELAELYERVDIENLIIVEHDPDIFYASLHTFDWSNLLNYIFSEKHSIDIIIDNDPQSCFQAVNDIIDTEGMYLGCSLFMVLHYVNDFIREFAEIIKLKFGFDNNLTGFFDDYLFGMSHAYYALSHDRHFVVADNNQPFIENFPVFIIGSGPSLDHDLEFIRENQHKALIIACGTAIDILHHTGIKPDFFASTERSFDLAEILNSFTDREFISNTIILCSEVCPPLLLNSLPRALIFGKANEPLYSYLKNTYQPFSRVKPIEYMNPLVGNMGISAAVHLGAKELYLFGIDNGRKKSSEIHSNNLQFYKKHHDKEENSVYSMTDTASGNFGGECQTNTLYRISAANITRLIQMTRAAGKNSLQVVNCSDGVYVEGTTPQHSEALKDRFSTLPSLEKEEICKQIYENQSRAVSISLDEFRSFMAFDEFSSLCKKIDSRLKDLLKVASRDDLLRNLREISEYLNAVSSDSMDTFHRRILGSSVQSMFIVLFNAMYSKKNFSDCLRLCQTIIKLTADFVSECEELFKYLPDYVLGEHHKYFKNGRLGRDTENIRAYELPEIK